MEIKVLISSKITPLFQDALQICDSLLHLAASLTLDNPVRFLHKDMVAGSPHDDQHHTQQQTANPNARYVDPVIQFKQ